MRNAEPAQIRNAVSQWVGYGAEDYRVAMRASNGQMAGRRRPRMAKLISGDEPTRVYPSDGLILEGPAYYLSLAIRALAAFRRFAIRLRAYLIGSSSTIFGS
jgi:hypothetical protein